MLTIGRFTGFGGGIQAAVNITDRTVSHVVAGPTDAYAGYRLNTDGNAERKTGTGGSWTGYSGEWRVVGASALFEVRATLNSGTLNSGTTGSWLALTSTRTWDVTETGTGVQQANLTIEIRRAATGVVLDTATIDLYAEST